MVEATVVAVFRRTVASAGTEGFDIVHGLKLGKSLGGYLGSMYPLKDERHQVGNERG